MRPRGRRRVKESLSRRKNRITFGKWTSLSFRPQPDSGWLPFSILQLWPFSWWVACVVDHYSRCVIGFAVFKKGPKSVDICTFLGRVVKRYGTPKYIISDKGRQFECDAYKAWCDRKGIAPRYAAAESIRATAVQFLVIRPPRKSPPLRSLITTIEHELIGIGRTAPKL